MTDNSKRGSWQFHLSTAILSLFVVGGMMWANFYYKQKDSREVVDKYNSYITYFGWPAKLYVNIEKDWLVEGGRITFEAHWLTAGIALNTITALAILAFVGFLNEWRIRRSKTYRPFQFRLSTAIFISLAVGFFLWLNAHGRVRPFDEDIDFRGSFVRWNGHFPVETTEWGWPLTFRSQWTSYYDHDSKQQGMPVNYSNILVNVLSALAILVLLALLLERLAVKSIGESPRTATTEKACIDAKLR